MRARPAAGRMARVARDAPSRPSYGGAPQEATDQGLEDQVDLGSGGARVSSASDVERRAVEAAEGDVGEGLDGNPAERGRAEQGRQHGPQHGQLDGIDA